MHGETSYSLYPHPEHVAQRRLEVAVHGEISYLLYPHPEHHAHVADVMVPPELQTCVPVPAAHTCTVGWCVMARGGAKAYGAGAAARCSGLGRGLVWRLGHGAWGHE